MIGKTIQQKRKAAGLTQAQVAERLGVTAPAVNRWEKDLCYPDATLLAPLARLLKTDLNELFSFYNALSDKERDLIIDQVLTMLMTGEDDEALAYVDDVIQKNPSDGHLIKEIAHNLYLKHSLLVVSSPHLYLDRITAYYERALELLPEENDSISYSLAIAYAELGDERKAEEAWGRMKDTPVEFNKKWVHAELMHKLKLYDRAVSEIEDYVLREAVDLSTNLDQLRDVLTLSGDEELSKIAEEKAVRFRELFELWEGFGKMSDVSKSAAAFDQDAMLENLAGLILTDARNKKVSACPLFANVKLGGKDTTEKSGADYMADVLSALGEKST